MGETPKRPSTSAAIVQLTVPGSKLVPFPCLDCDMGESPRPLGALAPGDVEDSPAESRQRGLALKSSVRSFALGLSS